MTDLESAAPTCLAILIKSKRQGSNLLVADLIHELEALQRLLDGDADVLLRERARPEGIVKVEEAGVGLHSQEAGHVLKVGKGSGQAHQPYHLLGLLCDRTKWCQVKPSP
jgi:hypothetical protein